MAWVKIDDHFDEHPKFARIGPLGMALWITGMAYCNRNLTDGFIPWSVARNLVNWEYLGPVEDDGKQRVYTIGITSGMAGDDVTCKTIIPLLVEAGLWKEVDGGYRVHDYDQYQPSKEKVLAERAANAERQQRFRDKQTGRYSDHDNGAGNTVSTSSRNGVTNEERNAVSNDRPVPVPVPKEKEIKASEKKTRKRSTTVPEDFTVTDALVEWGAKSNYTRDQMERQVPRFIEWHTAKGTTYKDWHAAFQGWMRRADEYGQLKAPASAGDAVPSNVHGLPDPPPNLFGTARRKWLEAKYIEMYPDDARRRGMVAS